MVFLVVVFAGLALLGHGYLWVAIVNRLHGASYPRWVVDQATNGCWFFFLALPASVLWSWPRLDWSSWKGLWLSLLQVYVGGCAVWGLSKLLWRGHAAADLPDTLLDWQTEFAPTAQTLGRATYHGLYPRLLSYVPGNQSLRLRIDRKRLRLPRLDSAVDGVRIAHLSDLHITGRLDRAWYDAVVAQVNQLAPHAIMITGDIIEQEACWSWLGECLGRLQAPGGVYFILGNHDLYIDSERTREQLEEVGLIYLGGRCQQTQWQGVPVLLAGNQRPWCLQVADVPARPADVGESPQLRIGLLHTPDQFPWAQAHDFDLALAGHTHGGQLCLPFLGPFACPSVHGTRYVRGVFAEQGTVLHVTRGIAGKCPLRWNCPPEVALLELVGGS